MTHRRSRPGRRPARRAAVVSAAPLSVTVERLGLDGDGIAQAPEQGSLYIPGTLPGERVLVRPHQRRGEGTLAQLIAVEEPSPQRQTPFCPHAGDCGGCTLQHLAPEAVALFKRSIVRTALDRQGLTTVTVGDVTTVPTAARRRVRWQVKGAALCQHRLHSTTLAKLDGCAILTPDLQDLMSALPALLATPAIAALGPRSVQAQHLCQGQPLDLVLGVDRAPDLDARESLAAAVQTLGLGRLSVTIASDTTPGPIAAPRPPVLAAGPLLVPLPAGSFLQPTAQGQAWMADQVRGALTLTATLATPGSAPRVWDLYAGLGGFTGVALSAGYPVSAVEGAAQPVEALAGALRRAQAVQSDARRQDLARDPLPASDLASAGLVILDPPRAGALAQCRALAQGSARPLVLMLSCNPKTFARDLAVLVAAGWVPAMPVAVLDQFIGSAHLEVACLLRGV